MPLDQAQTIWLIHTTPPPPHTCNLLHNCFVLFTPPVRQKGLSKINLINLPASTHTPLANTKLC